MMVQQWNLRIRSPQCARTGRDFKEKEWFHTAIYRDLDQGGFVRRDIASEAWEDELREHQPFSAWRSRYVSAKVVKPQQKLQAKLEAFAQLKQWIEENHDSTQHARYLLALMLERKRQLIPREVQQNEGQRWLIYEHRSSGDVVMIQDPQLHLQQIDQLNAEIIDMLPNLHNVQNPST